MFQDIYYVTDKFNYQVPRTKNLLVWAMSQKGTAGKRKAGVVRVIVIKIFHFKNRTLFYYKKFIQGLSKAPCLLKDT